MKLIRRTMLASVLVASASCTDFLNVNTNPNAPQSVSANLYLSPMLHWMVTAPQFDGRFVGRYTQQWTLPGTSLSTWDRMGWSSTARLAGDSHASPTRSPPLWRQLCGGQR